MFDGCSISFISLKLLISICFLHGSFLRFGYLFCSLSFVLEVFFRCPKSLDCLKNQVEAVTDVNGLLAEVFAVGLFGWVVSSLNPSIRIFRSFLVGWSCSPEKDSLIYCPEKEGLASGILETGSGRRLGLIFRAGPRPCTVPGMSFQPSFRREEQLGRDRTWVSNSSTRGV